MGVQLKRESTSLAMKQISVRLRQPPPKLYFKISVQLNLGKRQVSTNLEMYVRIILQSPMDFKLTQQKRLPEEQEELERNQQSPPENNLRCLDEHNMKTMVQWFFLKITKIGTIKNSNSSIRCLTSFEGIPQLRAARE